MTMRVAAFCWLLYGVVDVRGRRVTKRTLIEPLEGVSNARRLTENSFIEPLEALSHETRNVSKQVEEVSTRTRCLNLETALKRIEDTADFVDIRTSTQTSHQACLQIGYERSGKYVSSVTAVPGTSVLTSENPQGAAKTAVCVTGQIRGFPIALAQWRDNPVLKGMNLGYRTEVFFVTSATRSFKLFGKSIIKSLNPTKVHVVNSMQFVNRPSEDWYLDENCDVQGDAKGDGEGEGFEFGPHCNFRLNTANLPQDSGTGKIKTFLIIAYQNEKCRQLIAAREEETGEKFTTVARIRPDIFLMDNIIDAQNLRDETIAKREKDRAKCQADISKLIATEVKNGTTNNTWFLESGDTFAAGSRAVMMKGSLSGLEWLHTIKNLKVDDSILGMAMNPSLGLKSNDFKAIPDHSPDTCKLFGDYLRVWLTKKKGATNDSSLFFTPQMYNEMIKGLEPTLRRRVAEFHVAKLNSIEECFAAKFAYSIPDIDYGDGHHKRLPAGKEQITDEVKTKDGWTDLCPNAGFLSIY